MMSYDPSTRPEYDRLNTEQGRLWLKKQDKSPEYQALMRRMKLITPPGYEGVPPSLAGLQRATTK